MATHSLSTDEQIVALANSLNELLRVQQAVATSSASSLSTSAAAAASSAAYNNDQLPQQQLDTTGLAVIGSGKLNLLQFTLTFQKPVDPATVASPKGEGRQGNKAHVILYLDANPTPGGGPPLPAASLEVVSLALIGDKLPLDSLPMGIKGIPKDSMYLVKYWADLDFEEGNLELPGIFQATTTFQGPKMMSLSCKTSVCSFGHSIGEKIEKLQGVQLAANQVAYQSFRTPLCEFLANFLVKLKRCGDLTVQNNVLENFSILQVITDDATQEMLLCLAYIFEVCPPELSQETGAMCKVYRLENC